jgi:hypothetical protein
MSMDIYGKNPTSEAGDYFGSNPCWWDPLVRYVREVAPEITSKCTCWHTNDGDGLSEGDSRILADILQNEIDSGRTETYAQRLRSELEMISDLNCEFCNGIGVRDASPFRATDNPSGIICSLCHGSGRLGPWATEDMFSIEEVLRFASFLRACGGFEIW